METTISGLGFGAWRLEADWGTIRVILGLYWDNG